MPKSKKSAEQAVDETAAETTPLGKTLDLDATLDDELETERVAEIAAAEVDSATTADAEDLGAETVDEDDHETQLAATEARADENWERLLRLQAEMDNLRKRNSREVENAHKFALDKIATELLMIRDSLDNAILAGSAEDASVEKLQEGSELILKQLSQVMEKFSINEVDPGGEKFDPELHQAMSMQSQPDTEPNTVTAVLQKGYTLNGRLLRPALVMVSK